VNTEHLKFGLKFSVLSPITLWLVGVNFCCTNKNVIGVNIDHPSGLFQETTFWLLGAAAYS